MTKRVPVEKDADQQHMIVSGVNVTHEEGHDLVEVFNRGKPAGAIKVQAGDGEILGRWLMPYAKFDGEKPRAGT
jgi:hypothetical protein